MKKSKTLKKKFAKPSKISRLALKRFKKSEARAQKIRDLKKIALTRLTKTERALIKKSKELAKQRKAERKSFSEGQRKLNEALRKSKILKEKTKFIRHSKLALKRFKKAEAKARKIRDLKKIALTKSIKAQQDLKLKLKKLEARPRPKLKIKVDKSIRHSKLALARFKKLKKIKKPKIRKPPKPSPKPRPLTFDIEPPKIPKSKIPEGFKEIRTRSGQIYYKKQKLFKRK